MNDRELLLPHPFSSTFSNQNRDDPEIQLETVLQSGRKIQRFATHVSAFLMPGIATLLGHNLAYANLSQSQSNFSEKLFCYGNMKPDN